MNVGVGRWEKDRASPLASMFVPQAFCFCKGKNDDFLLVWRTVFHTFCRGCTNDRRQRKEIAMDENNSASTRLQSSVKLFDIRWVALQREAIYGWKNLDTIEVIKMPSGSLFLHVFLHASVLCHN